MTHFYHLTSFDNAQSIQRYGFRKGNQGMLGPGIYFAYHSHDTFDKAHSTIQDTIIVVLLDVGRSISVEKERRHWNIEVVKKLGYDSVQKINCRSGPEICVYEPNRIKIIGFVHWNNSILEFINVRGYEINEIEFYYLFENRKIIVVSIDQNEDIKSRFNQIPVCQNGHDHDCSHSFYCKHCGQPKCYCGHEHDFSFDVCCRYCAKPKCHCGHEHDCSHRLGCRYCGLPKCQCGHEHDFSYFECRGYCRYCGLPKVNDILN